MEATELFLFFICCGTIGILLKRNLLNIIISFIQIVFGLNGLSMISGAAEQSDRNTLFIILFCVFSFICFLYSIAIVMVRRRSTLNVNELSELRG
jgi:NADH:ubiquinone oxidoreductase subunit K